nr:reverse transcriptase domain-containing protein [Tanacetum cinerariifolium]
MSEQAELNLTPPMSAVRNTIQEVSQQSRKLGARDLRRKLRSRRFRMSRSPKRNPSVFSRIRHDRSESPRHRPKERRGEGVFNRLGSKGNSVSKHSKSRYQSYHSRRTKPAPKKRYHEGTSSRSTKALSESEDGRWGIRSQSRIRQSQALKKMNYPNHGYVKRQIPSHIKLQRWNVGQCQRGATCLILHSPDLRGHGKGSSESMMISEFMHGITNPELVKRLHDNISKSVNEMMRVTITFLSGEVAASNQARKKALPWRSHMANGTNIAASKDRGCITLNLYMYEFRGGEITISVQWDHMKAGGVLRHIVEHKLNVHKGCSHVRQKKIGHAPERNKAIQKEVKKLVDAGIMKEVHYHNWLSNIVMVKKHDDSWRICVDFKDLNKACPKDGYPLPEIDWKVESLCGYLFKCFLDAYKECHQIKMTKEDEKETSFITSKGIFCYSKMPFGLKNARATYQRLTAEAEVAFKQMKKLIAEVPTLTTPIEKEELIVYLAAAQEAVMAAPVVSISLEVSVESVGSSFLRVILICSIPVEVSVAPDVGAAAVASPVRVFELDTHSSSKADPSESSPLLVSVAPMVSPFLCSHDLESDIEILERHVSPTPYDAMLTRWRSRVASRSSSPTTSTLDIPTALILPASSVVVAPSSEPCRALTAGKTVRPLHSRRFALRYTSHHLDHFTSGSSSGHSSSDHSSSGHSISARPISVGGLPHYLPCYPSTTFESSAGDYSFESSAGPSCKRCRSSAATVTSYIHATRALVLSCVDLLPHRKRLKKDQEKDKIESKRDKNGKRSEDRRRLKQLQ